MRILITEDQVDLRQAVARRLRSIGHSVDEADSCASADDLFRIYDYAVVILDRMLPDGDSVSMLEAWRSREAMTPVLLLTARDQVNDRVAGLEAGADDYLVKPFSMDELVARITVLSRRSSNMRPSVLHAGDLEIDLGRREVRHSGTLLPLRPKEFAVLEVLVSRAGQVVSRIELLESCWDENYTASSNVEEVVVASLRRKLGNSDIIRTVRGAGYRFDSEPKP